MGCCCARQQGPSRITYFQRQNNQKFGSNNVSTTKYNIITFLPLAIIFQFVRPANFVYLLAAILQSIPEISSLTPVTAIAPFVFVILISLIREGYEDYKRHVRDKQINTRITQRLVQKQYMEIFWEQLRVGDIIKVKNNQKVPADFLLLHSSQENSLCYVQTANLDGQSNLKTKFAFTDDIKLYPQQFEQVTGRMEVQIPNSDLHSFHGTIQVSDHQQKQIGFDNLVLRQTILKNTQEAVGVIIYTGYDTKIIQNQGQIGHKVSHVQKKVNIIQFVLLFLLIILGFTCSIGFNNYHNVLNKRDNLVYLVPQVDSTATQNVLIYFSSFLLLTFLIPISLNVSIQVIKAFLGIFLSFDNKMYYQPIDQRCNVLNMSIIQQLGQVDYVLTDKTGTLTANQMVFKLLTLGKKSYDAAYIKQNIDQLRQDKDFYNFWLTLVICHDVVTQPQTGQYQGSSPDEVCFIKYSKTIGFQFVKRTKNSIQLNINGQKIVYQLITILPFSSRKRMSVVVRNLDNNRIYVHTKGADSCVFQKSLPFQQQKHLKHNIDRFAMQGYRTLLFSYRQISEDQISFFNIQSGILKNSKIKRELTREQIQQKQLQLIEKYQSQLTLLGATAIQDRLQDNVPQTISRLQSAGIVVMMITGDKLQTAQNIGYLANFIKQQSKIFRIVSGQTNIQSIIHAIKVQKQRSQYQYLTLIIEESSITKFISDQNRSYGQVLTLVSSVIFCRSSPKQKSLIVKFVKQKLSGIVLAIGDGGNDVGMIQQAHVGIGILGKQGNSASAASDFSIGQFKFIDRLLLHHGRWAYYRLSYFFVYYGWKNLVMTLLIYFFMVDSAFSAYPAISQPFIAVYNIIIGLALVVYYSIFQQDINDDQYKPAWNKLPLFYSQTKKMNLLSFSRYIIWTFFGCIIAIFIFCSIKFSVGSADIIHQDGYTSDYSHHAQSTAISLSLVVIMVLMSDIKMYTKFSCIFVIGILTVIGTIGFFVVQNYFLSSQRAYMSITSSSFRMWEVIFLNFGVFYAGKLFIDTIHFQYYETSVQKMLRAKKQQQQQANYLNMTYSGHNNHD